MKKPARLLHLFIGLLIVASLVAGCVGGGGEAVLILSQVQSWIVMVMQSMAWRLWSQGGKKHHDDNRKWWKICLNEFDGYLHAGPPKFRWIFF